MEPAGRAALFLAPLRAKIETILRPRLDAYFPRAALGRRLTEIASKRRPIRIRIARNSLDGRLHELRLRKRARGIEISCNYKLILRQPAMITHLCQRGAVIAALFAATSDKIRSCRAEFSDGNSGKPGVISFCSADPASILIPDPAFINALAYADLRRRAMSAPRWEDRDDVVVWRGSTTGKGKIVGKTMSVANSRLIQRTRMCLALRDVPGTDVRFAAVVQSREPEAVKEALAAAGILGDRIRSEEWLGKKFALDVDGNTNAWSNLFSRLLCGCCVIKVASSGGYRQWYYDDLIPWRHYVPAAADLSDLVEKIGWCRAHPAECEAIAAAGKVLADGMTFEGEVAKSVRRLNEELPRG